MLAQWFKANNYPDEARAWEIKANSIAEELGFDLPEN